MAPTAPKTHSHKENGGTHSLFNQSQIPKLMAGKTSKKKDKKKNTSLRLEPEVLKALKIRAIKEDSSVQQIVEKLVSDYLSKK